MFLAFAVKLAMNCRKRTYNPEEIFEKIAAKQPLDHCEELFYLVHMLHMPEHEAEQLLYGAGGSETALTTLD